ncbi:MAG: serine endoprotease DegQ [Colwelliaceae bacterium]|nr:serine endoprotease DegQ [Colwelliaceae bacterium]
MKKLSLVISAALISSTLALTSAPAHANLPLAVNGKTLPSLAPMLERTTPAVVSISVKGTHEVQQRVPDAFRFFFGNPRRGQESQERPFEGLGSGVIIDSDEGYIVTNNHVIAEADEILVTLKDGRQLEAKKIGADPESDIALLQVEADNLTEIKVSDSDQLRVGDFAVAIGSPFGLGQTVTSGIVSALGRAGLNVESFEDFIQTDAAINSGNSGGALVNLRGELIGINTAILGPNGGNVGIGFAIPSNMMKNLVGQILEFGEVRRGVLGVAGRSVNGEIAKAMELETTQGGFIEQVNPDSAAAEAGLKAGDVITKVNGKTVKTFAELRGKIGSLGAGKEVDLTIVRDGKTKQFTAKLKQAEAANVEAASLHRMLEGAELDNNAEGKGVEISSVERGSPAESIGLKAGDIISGVNRTPTETIGDLRNYLKDHTGVLALNVVRGNRSMYLMIR